MTCHKYQYFKTACTKKYIPVVLYRIHWLYILLKYKIYNYSLYEEQNSFSLYNRTDTEFNWKMTIIKTQKHWLCWDIFFTLCPCTVMLKVVKQATFMPTLKPPWPPYWITEAKHKPLLQCYKVYCIVCMVL